MISKVKSTVSNANEHEGEIIVPSQNLFSVGVRKLNTALDIGPSWAAIKNLGLASGTNIIYFERGVEQ